MALRGLPGTGGGFRRPPAGCARDARLSELQTSGSERDVVASDSDLEARDEARGIPSNASNSAHRFANAMNKRVVSMSRSSQSVVAGDDQSTAFASLDRRLRDATRPLRPHKVLRPTQGSLVACSEAASSRASLASARRRSGPTASRGIFSRAATPASSKPASRSLSAVS
jgi:hypothetical protein